MATAKGKRPAAKGGAAKGAAKGAVKKPAAARKRKTVKKDPLVSMPAVGTILLLIGAFALVCLLSSSNAVVIVAVRTFLNGTFGTLRVLVALLVAYLGLQTALGARWPLRRVVALQAALLVLCLMILLQVSRYDVTMYELRVINDWPETYNSFVWKAYEVSKNVAVGGGYVGAFFAYPLVQALDKLGSVLVLVCAIFGVGFWLVRSLSPSFGRRMSEWMDRLRDDYAGRRDERAAAQEAARQARSQAEAEQAEGNEALLVPLPGDLLAQEAVAPVSRAVAKGKRREPPAAPPEPPVADPPPEVRFAQDTPAPAPAPRANAKAAPARSRPARLYIENDPTPHPPANEAYSEYDVERFKYATRPSRKDPNAIPDFILKRRQAFDAQFGYPGGEAVEEVPLTDADEEAGWAPLQADAEEAVWEATPDLSEMDAMDADEADAQADWAQDTPDEPSVAQVAKPYVFEDPLNRQPRLDPQTRLDRPDWKPPEPAPDPVAPPADTYRKPPFTLLLRDENRALVDTREADAIGSQKLEETLLSFGVSAKVIRVVHGPAITRYELQPAPGIKVSKIVGLTDDIALNMAAVGVRIEAPIPGKAAIGIEIANEEIQTVYLREVLESEESKRNPSKLAVALGKDVAGKRIIADLARMPHLLIAGATGSGKSVCINTLITSIIYRATPDEVRLILIDPKKVELAVYNGIPHLLVPVVTDPKKASGALAWAVQEMDERYRVFADLGVRDIKGYNAHRPEDAPLMPQIVVIIDELSDLMLVAPGEVEESICRLAQLARACGIYLVIATQRPSVNVITGIIKANIPSRIAFAVSSQVDSRTILDSAGADKLLGKGDMLYAPSGGGKPLRVQGCFVSDDEVNRVVAFVKDRHTTDYSQAVLDALDAPEEETGPEDEGDGMLDALFEEAVEMAIESGQTSISMLQRRLRIGYARAGRLVDDMARRGIVGPADGAKPREVLMTREAFYAMFRGGRQGAGEPAAFVAGEGVDVSMEGDGG